MLHVVIFNVKLHSNLENNNYELSESFLQLYLQKEHNIIIIVAFPENATTRLQSGVCMSVCLCICVPLLTVPKSHPL